MQLSKNFELSEFTRSRFVSGGVVKHTPQQLFCVEELAINLLQPIRGHFGPLKVTSGLRNMEVYNGLVTAGYPASKTSDHFAWGPANAYGTGAADFAPMAGVLLKDIFIWAKDNLADHIGQLIIYPDNGFIHISNDWESIFPGRPERVKKKYLIKPRSGGYQLYKDGDL